MLEKRTITESGHRLTPQFPKNYSNFIIKILTDQQVDFQILMPALNFHLQLLVVDELRTLLNPS